MILTIQGTTFPSEVVVIGGHQDSIAGSNCTTSRSPGADDDASGIATISEVIRVAMALGYQPAAHGQVHGLCRGRGRPARLQPDRASSTWTQGINVVGVLQFDMTNYSGTPGADIVFYTDYTNAAQNAFLRTWRTCTCRPAPRLSPRA